MGFLRRHGRQMTEKWAEENGIIVGDENGMRDYKAFVTREELVAMLKRTKEMM